MSKIQENDVNMLFRNVSAAENPESPLIFFGVGDGNEVSCMLTAPMSMHTYNVDFKHPN